MKIKRSLIQICLFCVAMLPLVAQAQFTFTTNNGAITITGYAGLFPKTLNIPSTTNGYPVCSIGNSAFRGKFVTSVTIPNSVTNIGTQAFMGCQSMTNMSQLGSNVISIGFEAFFGCQKLTAIMVDTNNPVYTSMSGILFDKSQSTLIQCPGAGIVGNYTIPNSVTTIGESAFFGCIKLAGVTIPNSVITIGGGAFNGCNLTNVTLGTNVTSIGETAFAYCTSLASVTIPNSVTSIGENAFDDCYGLTNVMIGSGVTNIGIQAFSATSLMAITVDTNNPAFCSVAGVLFDKAMTTLIQFPGGWVGSYTVPNGISSIGYESFIDCGNLTSVTIPNSVTNIGSYAFAVCPSLTSIYFTGNALIPTDDWSVFTEDNNGTVYYLPGTTGWGAAFDGCPTVLWNPQAQNDASFGVQNNQFGFNITGSSNLVIVVEACTNLISSVWSSVSTNTLNTFIGTNGTSYFSDPLWTNYPSRFYRLRSP